MTSTRTLAALLLLPCGASAQGWTDPVQLSPPGQRTLGFGATPSGEDVVFVAYDQSARTQALLIAPIEGGAPARTIVPAYPAGVSLLYDLVPDGEHLVLGVYQAGGVQELLLISIDSGIVVAQLSAPLVPGGSITWWRLTPDGTRVAYIADQDVDEVFELYSVPVDASAPPVALNGPLPPGGDVSHVGGPVISPNGERIVYGADQDVDGVQELYVVPLDGSSPPRKLNPPLGPGDAAYDPEISADGSWVVFEQTVSGANAEVRSVPIDASAPSRRLSLSAYACTYGAVAPDGSAVAFRAYDSSFRQALFTVPMNGGPRQTLTNWVEAISGVAIGPGGERIVWDEGPYWGGGSRTLKSAEVGGASHSGVTLSTFSFSTTGLAHRSTFTADGGRLVYHPYDGYNVTDVWVTPADGSAASIPLSIGSLGYVRGVEVMPDDQQVLYVEADYTTLRDNLFLVPLDGSRLPAQVNHHDPLGVEGHRVSDDGRAILYTVGFGTTHSLWARRWLDVAPTPLRSGSAAGGDVFVIRGDGFASTTRVTFGGVPAANVFAFDRHTLLVQTPPHPLSPPTRGPRGAHAQVVAFVDVVVSDSGASATLESPYAYVR